MDAYNYLVGFLPTHDPGYPLVLGNYFVPVMELDRSKDGYDAAHHLAIQLSIEYGAAQIYCKKAGDTSGKISNSEGFYRNGRFVR